MSLTGLVGNYTQCNICNMPMSPDEYHIHLGLCKNCRISDDAYIDDSYWAEDE